jgi:Zn-dependent protease with chaperone function
MWQPGRHKLYAYSVLIFLFTGFTSSAQQNTWTYQFPGSFPSEYNFNAKEEYDRLLSEEADPKVNKLDFSRYAEAVAYGKRASFTSGRVYLNWDELEEYLNQVLQKILPANLKNKSSIHVYPTRDPSVNAFAIHDGTLFFNVGLLEQIEDEAALAIILGHELAHYIHQDSKNSYLRFLQLNRRSVRNNANKKNLLLLHNMQFSRKQESRADSLGYMLANQAGYNIKSGLFNYALFKRLDNKYREVNTRKKKKEKYSRELLATHPETTQRAEILNNLTKRIDRRNKKTFLVGEEIFRGLQTQARYETMQLMLSFNNYHDCIEKAFINHLINPEEDINIYYLLEGIRRACYIDKKLKTKKFLTANNPLLKKGPAVLADLKDFVDDTVFYKKFRAKELLDTTRIEFRTYNQAFTYFSEIAKQRNIPEAYLSMALFGYTGKKSAKRDSLLKKYLSFETIKYRLFAEKLLKEEFLEKENFRELVLVDEFTFVEDHTYGYHDRLLLADERQPGYIEALKKMSTKHFPGKEIKFISDELQYSTAETMLLREMMNTTFFMATEGEKKAKLFLYILEPKFLEYIESNDIKAVEYLKTYALDDKTYTARSAIAYLSPLALSYLLYGSLQKYLFGSQRYGYDVLYYSVQLSDNRESIFGNVESVHYKMTKGNFINTVYHCFKAREKFDEEFEKTRQKGSKNKKTDPKSEEE